MPNTKHDGTERQTQAGRRMREGSVNLERWHHAHCRFWKFVTLTLTRFLCVCVTHIHVHLPTQTDKQTDRQTDWHAHARLCAIPAATVALRPAGWPVESRNNILTTSVKNSYTSLVSPVFATSLLVHTLSPLLTLLPVQAKFKYFTSPLSGITHHADIHTLSLRPHSRWYLFPDAMYRFHEHVHINAIIMQRKWRRWCINRCSVGAVLFFRFVL